MLSCCCRQERQQLEQQWRLQAEQQRSALEAQWEDRLREERRALKAELDCLHAEEKHLAVESVRLGRQQQLKEAEQCVRQLQRQVRLTPQASADFLLSIRWMYVSMIVGPLSQL